MREEYKKRILKHLKGPEYRAIRAAKLAREFGVENGDYSAFKEAVNELVKQGRVVIGSKGQLEPRSLSGQIVGTFRSNARGFGFVSALEADSHEDLFIPPDETEGAMTGDVVAATITRKQRRGEKVLYRAKITKILERAQGRFVGTLRRQGDDWVVEPDGKTFVEPISVDDVTAKGAREKDKVVAEIVTWPTKQYLARGVILEVLGRAGQYDAEINSIIHQYKLPWQFGEDCIKQARGAAEEFERGGDEGREDITGKTIITIDPPDAKDFDDAISLERDNAGNFVLGVHIADVSTFIRTGTALDGEASVRGNSVYLPGRVIPMLPEILSNGICSLQPGQRRFVKSVYIIYDQQGRVVRRQYANSVMCSAERLNYEQADKTLKGSTKLVKQQTLELLKKMEKLARAIEARRNEEGMLHLNLPETELVLDAAGRVIDAHPAESSYPHTIIEMFMVEANEAVAMLLDRFNVPFMRRIHPEPDAMAMKELAELLKSVGFGLPRVPDRWAIQSLLSAASGRDGEFAVNLAVLRSLEKARYSPETVGHFALASKYYCHFTSPIRRYADLLVHRQLDDYLRTGNVQKDEQADLAEIGKHISFTEERAEDAEEELKTVLILQMLSKRLGDELDCVITGLTNFGIFARCKKFGIEGLIPLAELGGDVWQYNQKGHCVIGQRTGVVLTLGRPIKAKIVSVNIAARQLNLSPAQPLVTGGVRPKKLVQHGKAAKGSGKGKRERKKRRGRF